MEINCEIVFRFKEKKQHSSLFISDR